MEDDNRLKERLIKAGNKSDIKKELEKEVRFKLYKEDYNAKSKVLKFSINNAIDNEVELEVLKVENIDKVVDDIYKIVNEVKDDTYKVYVGACDTYEKDDYSFIGTKDECYDYIKKWGYEKQSYVEPVLLSKDEYIEKLEKYFEKNNPFTENLISFDETTSKSAKILAKFLSETEKGLKDLKNNNVIKGAYLEITNKNGEYLFSLETNNFRLKNKDINDFKDLVITYLEENKCQVYPLLKTEKIKLTEVDKDFSYAKIINNNYNGTKNYILVNINIGDKEGQYLNTSYPDKILSKTLTIKNYMETLKYDPDERKIMFEPVSEIFKKNKELREKIKENIDKESWKSFKNDLFANAFKDEVLYQNLDFNKEDLEKNPNLPIFYNSIYFNATENINNNFYNRFAGISEKELNDFIIEKVDEFDLTIENGKIKEFETPADARKFINELKRNIDLEFVNSIAGKFEQNNKGELYIKSGDLQDLQKKFLMFETGTIEKENQFLKTAYELYVAVEKVNTIYNNTDKVLENFNKTLIEDYGYHKIEINTTNMAISELNAKFNLKNDEVLINKYNDYMEINLMKTADELVKNIKEKIKEDKELEL